MTSPLTGYTVRVHLDNGAVPFRVFAATPAAAGRCAQLHVASVMGLRQVKKEWSA